MNPITDIPALADGKFQFPAIIARIAHEIPHANNVFEYFESFFFMMIKLKGLLHPLVN